MRLRNISQSFFFVLDLDSAARLLASVVSESLILVSVRRTTDEIFIPLLGERPVLLSAKPSFNHMDSADSS